MSNNTWAVTPVNNDALYRAAASIAGAGALTLLTSSPGPNGIGYKVIFTSSGNETGKTYTLTGVTVGGQNVTETLAGAAGTTTSTNYFASITSISAAAASVGNVKIGTTGSLALPRTRIRGVHYVGAASAGTIVVNVNTTSGTLLLQVDTPATATWAEYIDTGGIIVGGSARTDFGLVTLTQVSKVTFICG